MEKLYYSISEVADMFQINQSNLRFWEKEIKQLKPKRNSKGTRFYTNDDILVIKQIVFLVNEQKLTLSGVRAKLGEKKDVVAKQQEIAERLTHITNEKIKKKTGVLRKGSHVGNKLRKRNSRENDQTLLRQKTQITQ